MRILLPFFLTISSLVGAGQTTWENFFLQGGRAAAEGRNTAAEKAYLAAIEILEGTADSDDHLAGTLHVLAILYALEGRYGEAVPLATRALALRKGIGRADDPESVHILLTLGTISRALGRYPEAERWTRQAIGFSEHRIDPQNADLGTAYYNLALDLFAQDNLRAAEKTANRAVDAFGHVEKDEIAQVASLQGRICAAEKSIAIVKHFTAERSRSWRRSMVRSTRDSYQH